MARKDVRTLVVELVPHVDAGDRGAWRGDQNDRPLSELGRRQAEFVCKDLRAEPIAGLFSSPALRCIQTIEPLANIMQPEIVTLADLREDGPEDGLGDLADRGLASIETMKELHQEGRVIACSHGDLIPALAERIGSLLGVDVRPLRHRGQRYRIEVAGKIRGISRLEVSDFPR